MSELAIAETILDTVSRDTRGTALDSIAKSRLRTAYCVPVIVATSPSFCSSTACIDQSVTLCQIRSTLSFHFALT